MSVPAESPSAQQPPKPPQRPRRENARTVALIVLAVVITLFAVFNLEEAKVNWVAGSTKAPLILVIVISGLIGVLIGHFAERRRHR